MQLFLEPSEHSQFLFDCVAQKPDHVLISSFGIYAGISFSGQDTTQWGDKYRLATRDLLESMRSLPDVKILIGVAEYRSCKYNGYCQDCEINYAKSLLRLAFHAEMFPEFHWRVSTNLHLKCAIFFYGAEARGIAGGRNFTDSNWADVTVELNKKYVKVLAKHTIKLWQESPKLNDTVVAGILDSQKISPKVLESIVNRSEL